MATNKRELQILLTAKDKASKEIKGVSKSASKLGGAFKVAAGAAVAAGTVIVGVAANTIKAFQEQERAEKRLEQIAKQVTGSTDKQIQSFKDLASALQRVGVVGDEVLIAGQSQIASFAKSSETVSILSDDLADLAVAQYGVNVNQDQMIQTSNLLGKALSGQLGALTRTGILVNNEFKTAFENANTEVERAAVISQIVQDNYGGLNEAMRETSEGGVMALKNAFGDLKEEIGERLMPILQKLVDAGFRVLDWMDRMKEKSGETKQKMNDFMSAIEERTGILSSFREGWMRIVEAYNEHLSPAVARLWEALQPLMPYIEKFAKILGGVFLQVLKLVAKIIVEVLVVAIKLLSAAIEVVAAGITKFIEFMRNIKDTVTAAADAVQRLINKIKELNVLEGAKNAVSKVFTKKRANGGAVTSGQSYLVGENGPELFTPSLGGQITPNRNMGGGASVVVNFSNNSFLGTPDDVAEAVERKIMDSLRNQTRLAFS